MVTWVRNWFGPISLADPGGGAPGAPPPPNGRGPMIFYVQNANFSQFPPPVDKVHAPLRSNP